MSVLRCLVVGMALSLSACGEAEDAAAPEPTPPPAVAEAPASWADALASRDESVVLEGIRRVSDERIRAAALPLVRLMRESRSDMVRSFAADALAELRSVDVLLPLIEALGDARRWVRHSASDTLMAITGEDFGFDHTSPVEEAPAAQARCHTWFAKNEAALRERWNQPMGDQPSDAVPGVYRVDYEHADEGLLARLVASQADDLEKMTEEGRATALKMMEREHEIDFTHWRDRGEPLVLVLMADGAITLRGSHRAMRLLTASGTWSVRGGRLRIAVTERHGEPLESPVVTESDLEPGRAMLKWGENGFTYRFLRR